jgi:dihydrolipoamide dehydrogenase
MGNSQHYDAIIIGAGQAAPPLAQALAGADWRVALIERAYVGGTCINYGCTPTKTMIASAHVAYLSRRAGDYGINLTDATTNMRKIRERKRGVVESFRSGSRQRLEDAGNVDLIMGEARFVAEKTVEAALPDGGTRQLNANTICINTGQSPNMPPIDGLDHVPVLDSTTIMELAEVPDHLIILGGGYVGVEFGQMFRRLSSEVTIVERASQLMHREDSDMADEIAGILREDGITIRLNTSVSGLKKVAGQIMVAVQGDSEQTITGSHVLVALGRHPNTTVLDLETAGIETDDKGHIKTDDRLRTNVEGIYALGDVKGGPAFTHISYDDYRVLADNLLNNRNRTINDRLVPYCVYIDPELGRVGLTENQAREQKYNIRVAKMPMSYAARAIEMGETRGLMKAVVNADTDQILGCAILGVHGGEIMSAISIAMMSDLPYTALRDGIFAHPTLMESLNTLFSSFTEET